MASIIARSDIMSIHNEGSTLGIGPTDLIDRLCESHEQLRLERDMLALNSGGKDPVVFVVMSGDEVHGVVWDEERSGSSGPIKFPSYVV